MVFGSSKKSEKKSKDYVTEYRREEAPRAREPIATPSVSSASSYIGKTMKIEGDLVSDEDLTIEGEVKGTIEVGRTLIIGKNGNVTADIDAKTVKIIGKARGNIKASDKVAILSEGIYEGNINSERLVVAEGAILIGDINKEEPNQTPAAEIETKTEEPVTIEPETTEAPAEAATEAPTEEKEPAAETETEETPETDETKEDTGEETEPETSNEAPDEAAAETTEDTGAQTEAKDTAEEKGPYKKKNKKKRFGKKY